VPRQKKKEASLAREGGEGEQGHSARGFPTFILLARKCNLLSSFQVVDHTGLGHIQTGGSGFGQEGQGELRALQRLHPHLAPQG